MDLTLTEIAAVTGGALHGGPADRVTNSFAFDSRRLEPGACFVALRDARDGHHYVADAFERGAHVALVERIPDDAPSGALIVVPDALAALGHLGRWARTRLAGATVVGITGSAGKTATKDLTAAALASSLAVHASVGSFNNELGLPLTLLAAPMGTEVVVAEMGARFTGNVADLCEIARPDVGVVTNIGLAHAEHLGGRPGIARVKGELLVALPAAGVAVVNADDEATRELVSLTRARVLRVGARADADVRTRDVRLDAELRPHFVLETPWGTSEVALGVRGKHQVQNAAMAAAAALSLRVPLADVVSGLAEATTASWRMQLHRSPDGVIVLNDAYNASPTSVAAALESFAHLAPDGRRIFVFGEMLELGDQSATEHAHVGALAAETGVDVLVTVGSGARPAADAARERGLTVVDAPDAAAALGAVREAARPGDAVLVKASRAMGLEVLADALVSGEVTVS
ncbi:MAG: UDP-N-acetylmuramoyl-tripeptide--D-alanyl-D-alanine ligase [Acidimicrobiia bacterium]